MDTYVILVGESYYPSEGDGDWEKVLIGVTEQEARAKFEAHRQMVARGAIEADWAYLIRISSRLAAGFEVVTSTRQDP